MSNKQLILSARQCEITIYCRKQNTMCTENCLKDCFITDALLRAHYTARRIKDPMAFLKKAAKDYLDNLEA